MSAERIFVALSTFGQYGREPIDLLERSGHPFTLNPTGKRATGELLAELASESTVVVAGVEPYDAAVLRHLSRLRCIVRCGVGTDNIDHAAARAREITILNTPESPTSAVAELAVAMILAISRDLIRQTRLVRSRRWERVDARLLAGQVVGIVGLGRIGRRVAELLRPFEVTLLGTDPKADRAWALRQAVKVVPLGEMLSRADVITLHASSVSTAPLRLGRRELQAMRNGAVLVNLARGDVVDEAALIDALRSGHLRGAGLDVFPEEPYHGELLSFENVVLTPHAATLTRETRLAMEIEAVRALLAFLGPTRT